jgi:hypothetical protein
MRPCFGVLLRWPRVPKSAGRKLAKNGLQDSKTHTYVVMLKGSIVKDQAIGES